MMQAWEHLGFDSKTIYELNAWPKLSFGDWVGGDRDGHPLVTDQVTEDTLKNSSTKLDSCCAQETH